MHYNEDNDKTPDQKRKQIEYGHCLIMLPQEPKIFWYMNRRSKQWISAAQMQYMQKGYVPIACAPQESTGVQNVLVIILHVPKTIFQHWAELSCSKPKNGMRMTINSS